MQENYEIKNENNNNEKQNQNGLNGQTIGQMSFNSDIEKCIKIDKIINEIESEFDFKKRKIKIKTLEPDYRKAFSEVYYILKYLNEEEYDKIPKSLIEILETGKDLKYACIFDLNRDLNLQINFEETKAILFNIFRDYLATEEQNLKIKALQQVYISSKEGSSSEQKDGENSEQKEIFISDKNENLPVKIEKQKWYKKIFNFIKKLLSRKK